MNTDKWATSKSTQLSTKIWVKLLLLHAWKCQFWGPLTENLNPLQGPTHTLTPPSINTQNRSKNYVLIYHDMHWTHWYKSKKLYHTEKQGFGHHSFQIKFKAHPPKLAEVEPSFREVSLLPAKLHILFPAHLWVREFWPQIYSLSQALDWGLLSKILASTKMGGA